jgi:hypothetical protein
MYSEPFQINIPVGLHNGPVSGLQRLPTGQVTVDGKDPHDRVSWEPVPTGLMGAGGPRDGNRPLTIAATSTDPQSERDLVHLAMGIINRERDLWPGMPRGETVPPEALNQWANLVRAVPGFQLNLPQEGPAQIPEEKLQQYAQRYAAARRGSKRPAREPVSGEMTQVLSRWAVVSLGELQQPGGVGATQEYNPVTDGPNPDQPPQADNSGNSFEQSVALETWVNYAVDLLNRGEMKEAVLAKLAHDGCPNPEEVLQRAQEQPVDEKPISDEIGQDPFEAPAPDDGQTGQMESVSRQPPVIAAFDNPPDPRPTRADAEVGDLHPWAYPGGEQAELAHQDAIREQDSGFEPCPRCGSTNVAGGTGGGQKTLHCADCGYDPYEDPANDEDGFPIEAPPGHDQSAWDNGYGIPTRGAKRVPNYAFVKEAPGKEHMKGVSEKRNRQYEHIKEQLMASGKSEEEAKEEAARTVNKQRAEKGEAKGSRVRIAGSSETGVVIDRYEDTWGQGLVMVALDGGGTRTVAPGAAEPVTAETPEHPVSQIQQFIDGLERVEPTRPHIEARIANLEVVRRACRDAVPAAGFSDQVRLASIDSDAQSEILELREFLGAVASEQDMAYLDGRQQYRAHGANHPGIERPTATNPGFNGLRRGQARGGSQRRRARVRRGRRGAPHRQDRGVRTRARARGRGHNRRRTGREPVHLGGTRMTQTDSVFDVLAADGAEEAAALSRAVVAARTRFGQRFARFVAGAQGAELAARAEMIHDAVAGMVADVAAEYGADETAVTAALFESGGHKSDCSCGFCANKGKLPGADKDDEDDNSEKESSVRIAGVCAECHHPMDKHLPEDVTGEHGKGCTMCDCGRQVLEDEMTSTKHSRWAVVSADAPEQSGDHYQWERQDAEEGPDASPEIDKGKIPNEGRGQDPVDVGSKQHPLERQDIMDRAERKNVDGAPDPPSPVRERVDADEPIGPEGATGDNTKTWSGTSDLASPVTSKYHVVSAEA